MELIFLGDALSNLIVEAVLKNKSSIPYYNIFKIPNYLKIRLFFYYEIAQSPWVVFCFLFILTLLLFPSLQYN